MRSLRQLARRASGPFLGLALLSTIGSCELPKPQIPSIGAIPCAPPGGSPSAPAPRAGTAWPWLDHAPEIGDRAIRARA
ncbi:MAG: hypothetical protein V2B17_03560 [Chloroflexota bacterium]